MGNGMCYATSDSDGSTSSKSNNKQRKQLQSGDDNISQEAPRPISTEVYYTNPARRDEDFTFNDKLRLQSVGTGVEHSSSSTPSTDDLWQKIASSLVSDINKINNEADWAAKNNFQLVFAEDTEKILLGRTSISTKHLQSQLLFVPGLNSSHQKQLQKSNESTSQQQQSMQNNSLQTNSLAANFGQNIFNQQDSQGKVKRQIPHAQQLAEWQAKELKHFGIIASKDAPQSIQVDQIKMEFKVDCSAERILQGLRNRLSKFSQRVEETITLQQEKEFTISHFTLKKSIASMASEREKQDAVLASYATDIGQNLNLCLASVFHPSAPQNNDTERIHLLRGGFTFFESYDQQHNNLNEAPEGKKSPINGEQQSQKNKQNFGSLNFNIGAVTTKIRFYGEILDRSDAGGDSDEGVKRIKLLTSAKEFISVCKNIANEEESDTQGTQERLSEYQRREDDLMDSNQTDKSEV